MIHGARNYVYGIMVCHRTIFRRVFPLLLALLMARCAPVDMLNATISTDGLTVVHGVPYGPLPRQAMDIYRPAAKTGPLPVVVFFYGGAWQRGARGDYRFVAAELAKQGIVVAVPDYRLAPQNPYPDFLKDGADAVAMVRKDAAGWGGDPQRIVLAGHSAGAHIAAMLALDPHWLRAAGMSRSDLAGWVGISGPYDFLPIVEDDIKAVFAPANGHLETTQPITYADAHAPPTLLLQGESDTTVEPRNTKALAAKLKAAGAQVQVRYYPGVGHIGAVLGFAPLFRGRSPVLADVSGFVLAIKPAR